MIRELLIFMLSLCLKVQTDPEEVKQRDLWVTDFIPMQNIYKLALALTSKEIGNLIYQSFVQCISTGREGEGHYYSNILMHTGCFSTSKFSRVINTCQFRA